MRVVFMGTPDFAVPSLQALQESKHEIVGVVTQPDRPRGRGRKLAAQPVKELALKYKLPVIQPEKVGSEETIETLKQWNPQLIVVVAFGQILPLKVLQLPPAGCINVHASLLPKYRGAAPIHRAIINGEKETGITTMFMDEGLDTGDIILQEAIPIPAQATAGEIHDRLATLGAEVLLRSITLIEEGRAPRIPQDESQATYAPPLTRRDELIDWHRRAEEIVNQVRGMNPWPGAYTTFRDNEILKIWRAEVIERPSGRRKVIPGQLIGIEERGFIVATGHDGSVMVTEVQRRGKKKMPAADFLRGCRMEPGMILGQTRTVEA
ncbi:methionyl-tRNA formyltransferase [Calderihabitans maritimus]|uniref:Methionyl-tRNA formyltransferase n=1 Tax=Calderihabitans maritimus TaxID=1246530 RepID=A0A1Z5HPI5_9FIRM|nr:methionyl-tRNA formyltransferase [Calderihabitans maritimus]GAW91424.1 methionyl-tRNA formyltransferase [Calderihabitans maritimus]